MFSDLGGGGSRGGGGGGLIYCSDYEVLHKVNIWYDNRIGVSGVSQPLASINGGEMCSTGGSLRCCSDGGGVQFL